MSQPNPIIASNLPGLAIGDVPAQGGTIPTAQTVSGTNIVSATQFGAKLNGQMVTDGAITAGLGLANRVLTCATSQPFATAQPGMMCRVAGAGSGGNDLVTPIVAVLSSSQVVLAGFAGTTVAGATVMFGTLDTAALVAAATHGSYVKVPAGSTICLDSVLITGLQNVTIDLTGVTVLQLQSLNRAVFWPGLVGTGDAAAGQNLAIIGGLFPGTGTEQINNEVIQANNFTGLTLRGLIITNNHAGSIYLTGVREGRVLWCTIINTNGTQGYNEVNFYPALSGNPANFPQNNWAIGNYITTNYAGICATTGPNSQGGGVSAGYLFALNQVYSTRFFAIGFELGGASTNVKFQNAAIIGNLLSMSGSTSGQAWYCVAVTNDATAQSTDPTIFQDFIIALNVMSTGRHGILSQANRATIALNRITQTSSSTGNGIEVRDHSNSGLSGLALNKVIGNDLYMSATGGYGVWFNNMNQSEAIDNTITYPAGATGAQEAMLMGSCTDCHFVSGVIRNAPTHSWRMSACTDCEVNGPYSINPCSSSTTSSGFVDGASGGALLVRNTHHYDNRGGSAKMAYALSNSATGATCYRAVNTQIGATTGNTTGTFTALTAF